MFIIRVINCCHSGHYVIVLYFIVSCSELWTLWVWDLDFSPNSSHYF